MNNQINNCALSSLYGLHQQGALVLFNEVFKTFVIFFYENI